MSASHRRRCAFSERARRRAIGRWRNVRCIWHYPFQPLSTQQTEATWVAARSKPRISDCGGGRLRSVCDPNERAALSLLIAPAVVESSRHHQCRFSAASFLIADRSSIGWLWPARTVNCHRKQNQWNEAGAVQSHPACRDVLPAEYFRPAGGGSLEPSTIRIRRMPQPAVAMAFSRCTSGAFSSSACLACSLPAPGRIVPEWLMPDGLTAVRPNRLATASCRNWAARHRVHRTVASA